MTFGDTNTFYASERHYNKCKEMVHTVLQTISLYTPISCPSIWCHLAGDLAHASIFEPGIHTLPPYLKLVFTTHIGRMGAKF